MDTACTGPSPTPSSVTFSSVRALKMLTTAAQRRRVASAARSAGPALRALHRTVALPGCDQRPVLAELRAQARVAARAGSGAARASARQTLPRRLRPTALLFRPPAAAPHLRSLDGANVFSPSGPLLHSVAPSGPRAAGRAAARVSGEHARNARTAARPRTQQLQRRPVRHDEALRSAEKSPGESLILGQRICSASPGAFRPLRVRRAARTRAGAGARGRAGAAARRRRLGAQPKASACAALRCHG